MTPEAKVKKVVREALDELGGADMFHFNPIGSAYASKGIPDIVGSYRGRFFAIEVKANGGKPTALQLEKLKEINGSGAVGIVISPNGETVKRLVDAHIYSEVSNLIAKLST